MLGQNVESSVVGKRVFVVDDDEFIRESLAQNFASAGFQVDTASDGAGALSQLSDTKDKADVVILDWKMPGLTGIEVLQRAREIGVVTPVIFLTTLTDPIYEETALDIGAVDFVEKSRSFGILLKRVELILSGNRGQPEGRADVDEVLGDSALEMKTKSHRAFWKGQEVPLTLREFEIVKLMVSRAGTDVNFKEIHSLVHGENFAVGYGPDGYRSNVRTFIKRIRRKFRDLDETFEAIVNYPGFGYRWQNAPTEADNQLEPAEAMS